jgi:hypothetical protein
MNMQRTSSSTQRDKTCRRGSTSWHWMPQVPFRRTYNKEIRIFLWDIIVVTNYKHKQYNIKKNRLKYMYNILLVAILPPKIFASLVDLVNGEFSLNMSWNAFGHSCILQFSRYQQKKRHYHVTRICPVDSESHQIHWQRFALIAQTTTTTMIS